MEAVRDPLLVDVAVHVLYEGGLDFTEVAALLAPVTALIISTKNTTERRSAWSQASCSSIGLSKMSFSSLFW